MDVQRRGTVRRRGAYDDDADYGYVARGTAVDDPMKPNLDYYDPRGEAKTVSWLRPVGNPIPSSSANSEYTRVDAAGGVSAPSGPAPNWSRSALGVAPQIGYGTTGLNTGSSGDYMNDFYRGITTFLGQPTIDTPSNPYAGYSQEMKDLPAAFAGPNAMMTQLIIEKIRETDLWPIRKLLQFEPLTNPLGGTMSTLTFDTAMMARTAYEVTGRTVTSRESAKSWKTDLYIIGQQIERAFWKTKKGQLHWAMGLLQIARAALELLCFLAMSKVMVELPATTTPEEEFNNEFTWPNFDKWVRKNVDQWACIQRIRNGVDNMALDALDIFRQRQVAVSDTTLVLPSGAARYINQTEERTRFIETGRPRGDGDPFNNDDVLKVKGMTSVRVSREFKLDMKTPPIDEMFRNVSIGGSAYVPWDIPTMSVFEETGVGSDTRVECRYKTEHAGFERYYDTSRNVEFTSAMKWFNAGMAYRIMPGKHDGVLTNAGAFLFHGILSFTSLGQFQQRKDEKGAPGKSPAVEKLIHANGPAGGEYIPLSWDDRFETSKRYKEWASLITRFSRGRNQVMVQPWEPSSDMLPPAHLHTVGSYYRCWSPTPNGSLLDDIAKVIASHGHEAVVQLFDHFKDVASDARSGPDVTAQYAFIQTIAGRVADGARGGRRAAAAAGGDGADVKHKTVGDYTAAQLQSALRVAVSTLLMAIPLTTDRYWRYALQNNIPLCLGNRTAVPDMTWESGSALVVLPGLGKVMAGYSDYVLGARLTRIYDGSFRMLAGTVITNPEKAVLMPNVFVRSYCGGNSNEYYGIGDVARYRNGHRDRSMFSFLLPPGIDAATFPHNSQYFDLSGRFPVSLVAEGKGDAPPDQFHYFTAPLYAAIWGFAPQERSHERKISNYRPWANSLCFQEMQILCNVRGQYESLVPGHGHWGRDAETGDDRMRTGRAGQPRQNSIYFGNARYSVVTRSRT